MEPPAMAHSETPTQVAPADVGSGAYAEFLANKDGFPPFELTLVSQKEPSDAVACWKGHDHHV
jgi:hypothetical protein